MTNPPLIERRSIWRVGPRSTWTTVLPVVFIIVSLVSLVVLPIVVSRHTSQMRAEITKVAEPARRAANETQMDLSAELDKIIAFQVTAQPQYRDDYKALIAVQQRDRALLGRLAQSLGPSVRGALDVLDSQSDQWHQHVQDSGLTEHQLPAEVFTTTLFEHHPRYEQALRSSAALETAIQDAIDARLANIRDAERLNVSLTLILTVLALTSALLVAGLGRQMRLLAAEAVRRRGEAEREAAEAQTARQAAEREERRAAFLASAGQELAASLDFEQAVRTLARLFVPNLAEMCAIDIVGTEGELRRAAVAHRADGEEKTLRKSIDRVPEEISRAMEDREARLIAGGAPLLSYLIDHDTEQRSIIVVPLVTRGRSAGVVTLAAPVGRTFERDDMLLATELARHGALATDNARLYTESQQAVRTREEVLGIVSHDLRNPLNATTLASSLLQTSENLSAEEREQLDIIILSAKRMRRLIEDLLDVTRLEGGKQLPIEPVSVDVEPLVSEACDLFKGQATDSGISLMQQVAHGIPRVYADHHRILQVFSNLIGNAMKFTPSGGVIRVEANRRDSGVLFKVADTGQGIPREHLRDIFNPYWQGKRAERMGAGLGLPIARGIVESHGGQIWVESQPGGTTFFFTLPIAGDAEPAQSTNTPRMRTAEM